MPFTHLSLPRAFNPGNLCRAHPKRSTLALVALSLPLGLPLSLPLTAHAQQPPARPDAGAILQQQTAPLAAPARPSPPVLPPSFAPKPALNALPSAAIAVQAFTFSGNTVFSAAELAPLVSPLVGKSATLGELNSAADAVRQFYRQRGYLLAQAYLPRLPGRRSLWRPRQCRHARG